MSAQSSTASAAAQERAAATPAEVLVTALAREIPDRAVIATGVASYLAILAIAVARATHAPRLTYLACVGALDPEIRRLERSAESLRYLEGRHGEVTIPDLFDHARRGRVDLMVFSAAEIDGLGDTNMSAAGSLARPSYKFPGVAGAATLRRWVRRPILLVGRQSARNLVPRVQVASTRDRGRQTPLYTDLGVFEVGGDGARLRARHAWATAGDIAAKTGFSYAVDAELPITPAPGSDQLQALRALDPDRLRERLVG